MNTDPLNEVASGSKADELIRQREFGVYLREARVAAGLSTYDVADRLKLHEEIIKALENSRVDALPAAAFTQGYIKAYAKLLKIPADEIMRAYDAMVPEKITKLNVTSGVPAERNSHDILVKATGYALAVLIVVLFGFWVQQSGFTLSGNFTQSANENTQQPPAGINTEPYQDDVMLPETSPLNNTSVTTMESVTPLSVPPIMQQTAVPATEKKVETPVAVTKPAQAVTKPAQQIASATAPKPTSVVTVPVEPKPVMIPGGVDEMSLSSSAESWAEILDADNNRLFYSLLKSGDAHVIKGRAPFKVFLGNAPAVSVKVNNQAVDIAGYIRQNNVAHIKINAGAGTAAGGPRDNLQQVIDQFIPETPVVE